MGNLHPARSVCGQVAGAVKDVVAALAMADAERYRRFLEEARRRVATDELVRRIETEVVGPGSEGELVKTLPKTSDLTEADLWEGAFKALQSFTERLGIAYAAVKSTHASGMPTFDDVRYLYQLLSYRSRCELMPTDWRREDGTLYERPVYSKDELQAISRDFIPGKLDEP